MDVRLVLEKGKTRARVVHLHSEETIIGRRHDCDLRILSSQISRRHCLLSIHDGYLSVEDLDSVNGTFVNGKRIVGKEVLQPGDHLEVGPLRFTVEYELTQSALDRLRKERKQARSRDDEDLPEALPVEEEEPVEFELDDEEAAMDVVPLSEEETALVPGSKEGESSEPLGESGEPIPMAEELDDDADWELPESNDLRNILSEMEEKKPPPRPKGR
jgi:pSer/pThr/pTyr-binding forkhead associated (FHA) protein